MRNLLLTLVLIGLVVQVKAVQLSGAYTIDATQPATATNFQNFASAITYLTTANVRTDGGPANSSPFGVSGPVTFNVVSGTGPYTEQVIFPNITGASATNTITINGNGNTIQFAPPTTTDFAIVRFNNGDYYRLKNLTIKTTSTTYGWGIHFYAGSDYNIIDSCNIDISTDTSTTAANSAGIVFSNSLTSPTTTGTNGYFNTISNCNLIGSASSYGMYYGIVGGPASSSATVSANRFINNTIQDFYAYGIYWTLGNSTVFDGNTIRRTASKSLVTTTYGFYFTGGGRQDTVRNNRVTDLFLGIPTSTSTAYGLYAINYTGLSTSQPNVVDNNLFNFNNGTGSHYGLYMLSATNFAIRNNTIAFHSNTVTTTYQTYGLYSNIGTSSTSNFDLRNNIFYNDRTSTVGLFYSIYVAGAFTGNVMGKNSYFGSASSYKMASINGVDYSGIAAYQTATGAQDLTSSDYNPNFVSVSTRNFAPQEGWFNGNGIAMPHITRDVTGALRSSPIDIGAYEASPISLDVAASGLVLPATPYTAGVKSISATIRNGGATTITSAVINWTVNGVAQTPVNFTGSLIAGTISSPITLGNITVANATVYNIAFTVSSPNGGVDAFPGNNSASGITAAQLPGGTYTVNAAGAGATNFTSFTNLASAINTGGIGGALTINVTPNSGPYNEQVIFNAIQGSSAINSITINGNGERIEFNNTNSASIGIVTLNGSDYFTITNLGVRSLNASYGVGYLLTNGADSNVIQNCFIDISSVTGSSLSAGIAISSSLGSPTSVASNVGRFNRFEGNTITGNSSGGPYYGITLCVNNATNAANNGIIVRNNIIRDFTLYGVYMYGTMGSIIKGNTMSRPTKASPSTFYGIYGIQYMAQDTIENNIITQPFEALQTTTNTFYGMYFIATNVPVARPVIVKNNLIGNVRSAGAIYGFYFTSATSFKLYHNTVVVDHPTSTSTSVTQLLYNSGTPNTLTLRNNIFFMNRGGTGTKHMLYLATTSAAGYVFNNNVLHFKVPAGSTNNFLGYYNAANVNDLPAWKLVNSSTFDQASVAADPQFRLNFPAAPYTPGADSINNIGANVLTEVATDLTGASRTTTPDPGAYEFVVAASDAGLSRLVSPLNPISLGSANVDVMLKNYGTGSLFSSNVDWSINGTSQTTYSWTGSMNPGDSATTTIGSYNFATPGFYYLKAWTSSPNGVLDVLRYNDTINATLCTPLSGSFTINSALPASATNFTSFTSLVTSLTTCGISGNITINVAPGTYNEQVNLTAIPGLVAGTRIDFIGADSATTKVTFNPTNTNFRHTLLLQGVDNISFTNIKFENTGTSFGTAVQIFGDASSRSDSIRFTKCVFTVPFITSSLVNTFVVSSSLTGPTTGTFQNATALIIDSCTANGGYYGVCIVASTGARAANISITNSLLQNSYNYGSYMNGVEYVNFNNNRVLSIGRPFNYTSAYGLYLANGGVNVFANGNTINNFLGGYGIYMTTTIGSTTQRSIISNNMIQMGEQSNTAYGIYLISVGQLVVAHNSVNITSASSTASGLLISSTLGTTYNTVDIINNIFNNPLQGYVIYLNDGGGNTTPNILQPVNWKIDNNCYYGLSSFPYRSNNFISAALPNFIAATTIGNDSFSVTVNPSFQSVTNLRSTVIPLNNAGRVNTWVTTDIDGQVRGATPDIGVNEFTPPANDAGVIGFVLPKAPQDTGLTNVRVLVKNFGLASISNVDVSYSFGTTTHTRTYTGTLASNAVDTVTFDATSGPSGTSQEFYYTGNAITLTSYTSSPNSSTDANLLNDTNRLSLCRALSGTFTINASGVGANNFTSFGAAVAALNCGGVIGPVTFNVASGTYTEQLDLGIIPGASAANTIKFVSATQNRNDVILTFAPTNASFNYTVNFSGTNFVYFEHMTIRNTSTTIGRVLSFGLGGTTYAANNGIRFCNIVGAIVTTTADANALIYSAGGTHVQNITVANSNLQNGSMAFSMGGQNIINQFSSGLVIDSNNITNQYYYGAYLLQRSNTKIRNNVITPGSSAYYGIFISGASNALEIANNFITMPSGYATYISSFNYYGEVLQGRIYNNAMVVTASAAGGLYCGSCSNLKINNNSINIQTTSTSVTQGGIYLTGSTAAAPQVAAFQLHNFNNAISSATLPAVSLGNATALSGMITHDYNVYNTTGTVLLYINGTSIAPANFITARGLVSSAYSSDFNSYNANPTFTSTTNLTPVASNANSWVLNGRGIQEFGLGNDILGVTRSQQVSTGTPDIGAYEFTPSTLPPLSTVSGTIGYGNTQHFISFGDTIGTVIWGFSGTLPTSVNMRFFPGTLISNRATSPNSNASIDTAAHLMDAYWRMNQIGGSGYSYDVRLRYKPFQLGTIPTETDLKFADRMTSTYHSWWRNNGFNSFLDTVNNVFGMNSLYDTTAFTGTTDISSPLPVKLSALRATKLGLDAQVSWTTVTERNASHFIIERSFDRSRFAPVGRVAAAGNSSVSQRYSFDDAQVGRSAKNQTVYYRLKMVDLDGRFEYSPIVSVSFQDRPVTAIVAYPNPFQQEVTITITSESNSTAMVAVVDIMGKSVANFTQQVTEGDNMLLLGALSELGNGVYFVKVTVDGKEAVTKLIKQ